VRQLLVLMTLLAALALPASLNAADAPKPESAAPATGHRVFLPADVKWVDAPPSLPKGAKVFVLQGDPQAPGPFAMRIRLPAGYKVPPHFHPADENVTVLSGTFSMGMGDAWDDAKMRAMPPGSFSIMPASAHHFAGTKTGAVIQVNAMGPWGITYVNPKDDPRNQKPAVK